MLQWSCIDGRGFGYCTSEPDFDIKPIERKVLDHDGKDTGELIITGGRCKLNRITCGKYLVSKKEDMEFQSKKDVEFHINKPENKTDIDTTKKNNKKKKEDKKSSIAQQGTMF